jgi:hypothetical protein
MEGVSNLRHLTLPAALAILLLPGVTVLAQDKGAQGQSVQGQSVQGQSVQGQSVQGQSVQGQSVQGQSVQGQPAQEQPKLLPTRDVEITYDVTRPHKPKVRERVRWLASEHLERVEASGRATTIFDRNAHAVTLLTPANRTYRKLDGAPRPPFEPEPGAALSRGKDAVIAGLPCTEWSWAEDAETHTVCATADGVLLRLVVDGQTFVEARSVKFAPQRAELFQVPPGYAPALAPEGAAEP